MSEAKAKQLIADQFAQELANRGKLVEGGWKAYELLSGLDQAPEVQRNECRKAFFLGAQHLWGGIIRILEPGSQPTEHDLDRLHKLDAELNAFLEELRK